MQGSLVSLKYTVYKLIKGGLVQVRVFRNSTVTVRFLEDVWALDADSAKIKADERIASYLKSFKLDGVVLPGEAGFEQLSRHYALLGTGIAKKYVAEKRVLITHDWVDGKVRQRIDFSKSDGKCKPEIDAEHVLHGREDVRRDVALLEDVENKYSRLPSVLTAELDEIS